ncbi:MAG: P-loop NTPase [Proteobacteria bacterium]|nr:P-loop NTPase [Pseudomonadota bacterium]
MEAEPTIIPVAGGKGGVGKSLVAANIAISLAELGKSTIAVDLDLGGSSLHNYLGLHNTNPGIGDYLKAKAGDLESLLVPTAHANLHFLPGDGHTPFMANIQYVQKIKLLKEIKRLPADYIILDLGAGSSYNVLDYFGLAHSGIIVATFDYSSMMNVLGFLRNFIYRLFRQVSRHNKWICEMLEELYHQPISAEVPNVEEIIIKAGDIDAEVAEKMRYVCDKCRPRFIFNMGDHPDELNVLDAFDKALRERLSIEADYIGFVFEDPSVRRAVKKRLPLVSNCRDSVAAKNLQEISKRVVHLWNRPVENSIERLIKATMRDYEEMPGKPGSASN